MKSKNFSAAIFLAAVILIFGGKAFACGPDFPNNLLNGGDQAVLQAPVADFQRELERMKLVATTLRAVPPAAGQNFYEQSAELEMSDLAAALKREKFSSKQAVFIMQSHLAERMKLNAYLKARHEWECFFSGYTNDETGYHVLPNTNPPPIFPDLAVTPGLPREFALYFQGAIAWQKNEGTMPWDRWKACESWELVLALPPAERHFKSIWAEFMLGKYYENPTNDWTNTEALKHFEQVRALAKNGFADSSGLATASVGEAAKIYLRQKNYERAIELYLEQFVAGDGSAAQSLRVAAAAAVTETNAAAPLKILALNPRARRVVTAYLISRNSYLDPRESENDASAKQFFERTSAWLDAVEAANVKDVESAGQLALAAYQASQMDIARRWINRADGEPVAQWLQAKLLMRAGKISEAAKLLAKLSRQFPQELPGTNTTANFAQSLFVDTDPVWHEPIAIGRQTLGELGVLQLARREFVESLDALLRSGYWVDAAYVAERVLATDELKKYVDQNWGAAKLKNGMQFENGYDWRQGPIDPGQRLRWLLARRLARENRFAEARSYFPGEWQTQLDLFTGKMHDGRDKKLSALVRADAMFAASRMMRTNGMELFGTELQPDWFVESGNFEAGVMWQDRATNSPATIINLASPNEISRAVAHGVAPDERWHYRELSLRLRDEAGDLAWEAAKTMPDNADDTARFLCIAGQWKRALAAQDKFYKTLVNRCRKTAIGAQADRMRWFPKLDENGNPKPWPPPKRKMLEADNAGAFAVTNGGGVVFHTQPMMGTTYVVRAGDSFVTIAKAAGVTVKEMFAANTNLDATLIRVGQLITIPKFETSATNSPP